MHCRARVHVDVAGRGCYRALPSAPGQGDIVAAREALERAKGLIRKTERPYEPHTPAWDGWEPLEYEGVRYDNVSKKGEIVGYHRRNEQIQALEAELGRQ